MILLIRAKTLGSSPRSLNIIRVILIVITSISAPVISIALILQSLGILVYPMYIVYNATDLLFVAFSTCTTTVQIVRSLLWLKREGKTNKRMNHVFRKTMWILGVNIFAILVSVMFFYRLSTAPWEEQGLSYLSSRLSPTSP